MESRVVSCRRAERAAVLAPRRPRRWWQHPVAQGAAFFLTAVALDRAHVKRDTVLAATALTCAAMLSGSIMDVADGVDMLSGSVAHVGDVVASIAVSLDGVSAAVGALGKRRVPVGEGVSPAALPPPA